MKKFSGMIRAMALAMMMVMLLCVNSFAYDCDSMTLNNKNPPVVTLRAAKKKTTFCIINFSDAPIQMNGLGTINPHMAVYKTLNRNQLVSFRVQRAVGTGNSGGSVYVWTNDGDVSISRAR